MNEREIFVAALLQSTPDERDRFLADACAADPELRNRIELLLRLANANSAFLETPCGLDRHLLRNGSADDGSASTDDVDSGPACNGHVAGAVIADRYRLVEVIGRGGMGIVWRAEQLEPVRRMVALKLSRVGLDSTHILARFQAE